MTSSLPQRQSQQWAIEMLVFLPKGFHSSNRDFVKPCAGDEFAPMLVVGACASVGVDMLIL